MREDRSESAVERHAQRTSPGDGQTSCKVWLAFGQRRRCSNEAKTRNPLKLQGCPKPANRSLPLVGRSSPYYGDIWRRYCCLISFFSDCRYVSQLLRQSPTKLCDGAQISNFWRFFASRISASRVQHVSDLHPKFALRPHYAWKYGKHPICDA